MRLCTPWEFSPIYMYVMQTLKIGMMTSNRFCLYCNCRDTFLRWIDHDWSLHHLQCFVLFFGLFCFFLLLSRSPPTDIWASYLSPPFSFPKCFVAFFPHFLCFFNRTFLSPSFRSGCNQMIEAVAAHHLDSNQPSCISTDTSQKDLKSKKIGRF